MELRHRRYFLAVADTLTDFPSAAVAPKRNETSQFCSQTYIFRKRAGSCSPRLEQIIEVAGQHALRI